MQVLVLNNIPVFFAERDGPWFPTLRLLHQYPDMMVKLRVDAGAQCFRAVQPALVCCSGHTGISRGPYSWSLPVQPVGSLWVLAAETL